MQQAEALMAGGMMIFGNWIHTHFTSFQIQPSLFLYGFAPKSLWFWSFVSLPSKYQCPLSILLDLSTKRLVIPLHPCLPLSLAGPAWWLKGGYVPSQDDPDCLWGPLSWWRTEACFLISLTSVSSFMKMESEYLPHLECQVPGAQECQLLPIPGAKVQSLVTQPHSREQWTSCSFWIQASSWATKTSYLAHQPRPTKIPFSPHYCLLLSS